MKVGLMERVMKNEYMSESLGKSNACRKCGQFIKNGEIFLLIIINGNQIIRQEFPKESNFYIHKHEWEELLEKNNQDQLSVVREILSTKQPAAKNRTPVNEELVERFKEVATKRKLRIGKETANRIYFKPSVQGRIGDFYFDKRSGGIEYNGRGYNGLFDRMFLREFISRINEDVHKKDEGFRVDKVIDEAVEQVKKFM